jgi:hypothetical protein
VAADAESHRAGSEEEHTYRELQRRADAVASLIVASDWAGIDVVIEIRKLKEFVQTKMPGRRSLFEIIYESRFKRLWQQFRGEADGGLPEW